MNKIIFSLIIIIFTSQLHAQDRKLKITIDNSEFTATLNSNETTDAFIRMLPMTVTMNEMGGYEKYFYLPQRLPGSASGVGTTYEGDLMIWSSNCLVLFYTTRSTSYSYIRLGRIDNTSGLQQAVGTGNVQIRYELDEISTNIDHTEIKKEEYQVFQYTHYIQVSGNINKLSLYSVNGIAIVRSDENKIDTGYLKAGIYLLRIETKENGIITKKIMKS